MMFGVHLTLPLDKLSKVVLLRRQGKIVYPKGVNLVEEYVWGLKFLVLIVESDDLRKVMDFAKQFSGYATDLEVGSVTTLRDLAQA
jgi:hypothetical protein